MYCLPELNVCILTQIQHFDIYEFQIDTYYITSNILGQFRIKCLIVCIVRVKDCVIFF